MLDALAALLKAFLYAGLLTSAGLVFAAHTLPQPPSLEITLSKMLRWAALSVILACIGGSLILHQRLGGSFDSVTFGAVFSSTSGAAMFMQIVGAILILALGDELSARGTRLASASILTVSFALTGHAASVGPFQGLIAAAHASAAAWWIGSLFLLYHGCRAIESHRLAELVRRFSSIATMIVGVLAVSGVLLIATLTDFAALPALTDYEMNLALKLFFAALVLGLATYNKFRLTPRVLAQDAGAIRTLRNLIAGELAILVGVLAATAILTTYTSPHS